MIAHMTPQTRDLVVNGPEGRSGGLLRCAVSRRQNSYSHERCYAARAGQQLGPDKAGQHQAQYDFVVYRADGSAVRFHPDWSKPEFPIYDDTPHAAPVRPPPTGWGGKGGGWHKHFRELDKMGDGKFDAQRGSLMLPNRTGYP